ncbi:MAG TPA: hypothetical protein VHV54_14120 [Candidatus Binatia bacterium]|nr:hypothetical protein [Candidatus Binatia bacterium]
MKDASPISDLDDQKRRQVNTYIWLSIGAGLIVPFIAQMITLTAGILRTHYGLIEYAWFSLPFIYLSYYLAGKKSQWDVKMFQSMWRTAMLTACIIYLVLICEMEVHGGPRSAVILFFLPVFTVFCMRFAMSARIACSKNERAKI